MSYSIYIIAGELSGDIHGSHLMGALQDQCADVSFHGVGGGEMREVGGDGMVDWVEDAAVMGIWEVLKHYKWFKKRFYEMLDDVVKLKPDALILIDYPGFNLRFAKAVREKIPDIKIVYYISPQVWAWNKGRIPKMAALLDLMLCILPFEKELYESSGLKTEFVGHPLVDEMIEKKEDVTREQNLIGLFPGSREREVSRLFPVMVDAVRRMHIHHPDWRYEAAASSPKMQALMSDLIEAANLPDPKIITLKTGTSHSLMQRATCGVVASGTATLEAALLGLPYCLVYKIALPTWILGKLLVKIKWIGLVNILANEEIVEELIQSEANPSHINDSLSFLMTDDNQRDLLCKKLAQTASKLGEPKAHLRAASEVLQLLKEKQDVKNEEF